MLSFVASSHSLFDSSEVTNTVLALRTLGTFDFDGKMQIKANSWHSFGICLLRHMKDLLKNGQVDMVKNPVKAVLHFAIFSATFLATPL